MRRFDSDVRQGGKAIFGRLGPAFLFVFAMAMVASAPSPVGAALLEHRIFLERDPANDQGDPEFDLGLSTPLPTQFVATFEVDTADIPADTAGGFDAIALHSFLLQIGTVIWTDALFPAPTIAVRSIDSKINGVKVPLIETSVNFVTLQIGGLLAPFGWNVTTGETVIGGPEPTVSAVPLPAAWLLFLPALVGLAAVGRFPFASRRA